MNRDERYIRRHYQPEGGPIEDLEIAWRMAKAEKPFRDAVLKSRFMSKKRKQLNLEAAEEEAYYDAYDFDVHRKQNVLEQKKQKAAKLSQNLFRLTWKTGEEIESLKRYGENIPTKKLNVKLGEDLTITAFAAGRMHRSREFMESYTDSMYVSKTIQINGEEFRVEKLDERVIDKLNENVMERLQPILEEEYGAAAQKAEQDQEVERQRQLKREEITNMLGNFASAEIAPIETQ